MKTRKLGSLEVSEIGFGNMTLSGGHYWPGVDGAQGIRLIPDARFQFHGANLETETVVMPFMFFAAADTSSLYSSGR